MRFQVVFILITAATAAPSGGGAQESESSPTPTAAQGGAEPTAGDQGNEVAKAGVDNTKDDDWEKRPAHIKTHDPVCTGNVTQVDTLVANGKELTQTGRSLEQVAECRQDVDIISERGNKLGVYRLTYRRLCSLELCDDSDGGEHGLKHNAKRIEKGDLVTPSKAMKLQIIANKLLKQPGAALQSYLKLVMTMTMGKQNEFILKEVKKMFLEYKAREIAKSKELKEKTETQPQKAPSEEAKEPERETEATASPP